MEQLKPCPFCGTDLQRFPEIMCINRAYNEDYLKWLHENGKFVGSDGDYQVSCIKCGSTSARGVTKSIAISNWNRRADNSGEKIFEGDIIQDSNYPEYVFRIEYHNGTIIASEIHTFDKVYLDNFICFNIFEAFVIGNIHDNPELLNK